MNSQWDNSIFNKFFGNARSIRKVIEKAYRNHELRMADLPKAKRTDKVMKTLILDDVIEFVEDAEGGQKGKGIGFKFGE